MKKPVKKAVKTPVKKPVVPRGLRQNNPGNIRATPINWKGEVRGDGVFESFATPQHGIRAMGRVIASYRKKHGLNTVRGVISRWAPSNENDTQNYIARVSNWSGVGADVPLSDTDLPRVVAAMVRMENGSCPYAEDFIRDALAMA